MNLNKVFIVGRITKDPEIRALPSGSKVASFGMATNRFYKAQDGTKKDEAEFHNVSVFGKLADVVENYVKKGGLLLVEGRIKTDSWEKDGIKRYSTKIIAESIQLGPRPGGAAAPTKAENNGEASPEELEQMNKEQGGGKAEEIDVDNIDFG